MFLLLAKLQEVMVLFSMLNPAYLVWPTLCKKAGGYNKCRVNLKNSSVLLQNMLRTIEILTTQKVTRGRDAQYFKRTFS